MARRFVAGETLPQALAAVKSLNASGISASLDLLGESVTNETEARAARDEYVEILSRIHDAKLDANVSVKLTAMGLDISEDLCVAIMHDVLTRAREVNSFVRLDMESSAYTDRTMRLFEDRLYPSFRDHVGIVLQSYLYSTAADVEHANSLGCRVRLCKGAYREPETVAFPAKRDVDRNYAECMRRLMEFGNYPGLATHDLALIDDARRFAAEKQIAPDRY
jgi:proline dehydrogenase